ncbi:TetR/AcrR family transcriptional regulator C-terminal domain-containing protein [Amycolatopsis sp. NPDC059021]|uniref:TetR/AcrR family transcriptional regulator C-terminal domain-containing protein n=1 Tax=Amycolatopsis sp. NPDC059021 TaxID=3346704 RepID=UPI00366BF7B5
MARRESLNREKVLDAALALADSEGLDGLTMRKLARTLGVEAMALYNHVSNKADILDGITERVMAGIPRADPALPWAERVRTLVLGMYRAYLPHPVVPLALVSDQANPNSPAALATFDDLVGALAEAGFDDDELRQTTSALNSLVFGSLLLTTSGFGNEAPGLQQLEPFKDVDPAELPHFSRLLGALRRLDPEKDFERGLDVLIAGLEATAAAKSPGGTA